MLSLGVGVYSKPSEMRKGSGINLQVAVKMFLWHATPGSIRNRSWKQNEFQPCYRGWHWHRGVVPCLSAFQDHVHQCLSLHPSHYGQDAENKKTLLEALEQNGGTNDSAIYKSQRRWSTKTNTSKTLPEDSAPTLIDLNTITQSTRQNATKAKRRVMIHMSFLRVVFWCWDWPYRQIICHLRHMPRWWLFFTLVVWPLCAFSYCPLFFKANQGFHVFAGFDGFSD